jgi:hypothetical protein
LQIGQPAPQRLDGGHPDAGASGFSRSAPQRRTV